MADDIKNPAQETDEPKKVAQFKRIYDKLTTMQKVIISGAIFLSFVAVFSVMIWATSTEYAMLFSNLSQADASKVIQKLQDESIPYEIRGNGNLIYVPESKVYDMRLMMAGEGLPEDSMNGYEIFDDNKLGMTDFMQRLNTKRALEGELARTISSIKKVSSARVHLVIPKRVLFSEDKEVPTASVVLKLKGNSGLGESQINGIVNLISNSVEGLSGGSISILDNRGNQLNRTDDMSTVSGLTSSQYEIQKSVENSLAKKAQVMLDKIVGPGRSIVKVNALLNFQKNEQVFEKYDPEFQVLRSEERTEEVGNKGDGANSSYESTVSNYDINKTISTIVSEVGNIKKISVAVSVDGIYEMVTDEDGVERRVFKLRSQEELASLEKVVSNALGVDTERGDLIELENFKFIQDEYVFASSNGLNGETIDLIKSSLKYFAIFLVLIITLIVFRSFLKRSTEFSRRIWPKLIANEVSTKVMTADGDIVDSSDLIKQEEEMEKKAGQATGKKRNIMDQVSDETKKKQELRDEVREFIEANPEDASSLLKTWLYKDGELIEH